MNVGGGYNLGLGVQKVMSLVESGLSEECP